MQDIRYSVHIFKEGDMYVAHVPELDVSRSLSGIDSSEEAPNITIFPLGVWA